MKRFEIEVNRIETKSVTIVVHAENKVEASMKAFGVAYSLDFNEEGKSCDVKYEAFQKNMFIMNDK